MPRSQQDHLLVAGGEQIFCGEQQFLDLGREAALQQHRLARLADRAQQGEILHVAGADLERVGMFGDDVDVGRVHHLGDDRQAGLLADLPEKPEALRPVPWKP